MKFLDLTLENPAANVSCDEALLNWCEAGHSQGILRFWESPTHFVVLGYSNRAGSEVNLDRCATLDVPVLRRCSGGGAVLQGPGCFNYSLILPVAEELETITAANYFVMERNRTAIQAVTRERIQIRGHTDLAVKNLKFSGNAQRRRKNFVLFHGCFLLNFEMSLMDQLLKFPSRQPDYRQSRSHAEFLTCLPLAPSAIKATLREHWHAEDPAEDVPSTEIQQLVQSRYSLPEWNLKW